MKVYVDDVNSIEKIRQTDSQSTIGQNKRLLLVHSPKTEHFFEEVNHKAEEIGMVVNQSKTQLLCLSASIHDQVSSYIRPLIGGNQAETRSGSSLKILGFNFNTCLTVSFHIQALCGKFQSNLWSLRQLRRSGMKPCYMINIYKTTLGPIIEYTCVTYGPMLNNQQSTSLERLQLRSLKIVYGINISYATVCLFVCLFDKGRLVGQGERKYVPPMFPTLWAPSALTHSRHPPAITSWQAYCLGSIRISNTSSPLVLSLFSLYYSHYCPPLVALGLLL